MISDNLLGSMGDQNIYPRASTVLSNQYMYNEENEQIFKSPIGMRGGILID
jgi:hypothetical protein